MPSLPLGSTLLAFLATAPGPAWAGEGKELVSTTDSVSQSIVAVVIAAVFMVLALEKAHRVLVIFVAVGLLWLITYLTPYHLISFEASHRALDLNVIFLLAAMMAVVGVLKTTGVFSWAVTRLLQRSGGRPVLVAALVTWFTGLLSSVADNVTTVIFVTPMVLEIAERMELEPAALLLPMVMASNIGGTATLIGDPPNIMIGSGAGLSFLDFVVNLTVPVLCMMVVLEWFSARYYRRSFAVARQRLDPASIPERVIEQPTLLRWGLGISAAIFVGFFTHALTGMQAAVPAVIGAAALLVVQDVLYLRTHDASVSERAHGIINVIEREIEWPTLSFFAFLFIAVGAAVETGLIDTLARGLVAFIDWGRAHLGLSSMGTLFFAAMLVLWASGVLSALIDNIPYVAVTIPIIAKLTTQLSGDTEVLWWALALGACLGGNGTPIGASANVTVLGLAEKAGYRITFPQFLRYGVVVTGMTLAISSVFIGAHIYIGQKATHLGALPVLGAMLVLRVFTARRPAGRRMGG